VYTRKIEDSEMPISAENTQNKHLGGSREQDGLMPAEITKHHGERRQDETAISGGLTNIA